MLKHSLDAYTVSINDKFNRAQWKYCSPQLEEEISKDIHMGFPKKIYNTVYLFLKWNVRDINFVKSAKKDDPINAMFQEIRTRVMDTCPILCLDPDKHFAERKCFPIYKVYHVLKEVDPIAANHLLNAEFRNQILENIIQEERLSNHSPSDSAIEKIYPIYSLPSFSSKMANNKKKVVLIVDFAKVENFHKEDEIIFYTGLNNLLDNVNQNFTCMMAPAMGSKLSGSWNNFVSNQINNAEIILIVFSPLMTEILVEWKSLNTQSLNSTVGNDFITGLKFLWNAIKSSHKPVAGVVFERNLANTVGSMIPVVFYLPTNLKLLLGYLLQRMECL